jgi:pimeloyl-ACP methyl ester carboxylesterase
MFALEQGRAALELGALRARRRLRQCAPRGDGHPVLVLPGLLAGDFSTANEKIRETLKEELLHLRDRHHRRVSLIGWSLGGIYARELARSHPEHVRLVITLGTPFRDISATHAARLVAIGLGGLPVHESDAVRAYLRRPVPVPTTSIYSRSDGIVAWQSCIEEEGPQRENVEVQCSHTGMGFHADALEVIANRLAQPDGAWRPFRAADTTTGTPPR